MGPYVKMKTAEAIDEGWEVIDGDGEVIAIFDTEILADAVIAYLVGVFGIPPTYRPRWPIKAPQDKPS